MKSAHAGPCFWLYGSRTHVLHSPHSPEKRTLRFCEIGLHNRDGAPYLATSSESPDLEGGQPLYPGKHYALFLKYGFMWQDWRYELIHDNQRPDFVYNKRIPRGPGLSYADNLARLSRETFSSRPIVVASSIELMDPSLFARDTGVDYFLSSYPDSGNNICVGGTPLLDVLNLMQHFGLEPWMRPHFSPKTRFCNYISNYSTDKSNRAEFCEKLMRYKPVDCPSQSLNNMSFPAFPSFPTHPTQWKNPKGGEKFSLIREKLFFIKDYKFTIAFENGSNPGYVTEKISDSLAVGSIPIYWGCETIADYYNPQAFINCHDYPDFDAVIERVIEVDTNPELYEQYLNAPPTLPGQHYDEKTIIAKSSRLADDIYAEAMRRRQGSREI